MPHLDLGAGRDPFLLLDDASAGGSTPARLYRRPVEIVRADRVPDILPAFARLRAAVGRGLHAAGFLGYEAGAAFEPRLAATEARAARGAPLLWFGLFDRYDAIDAHELDAIRPNAPVRLASPRTETPHGLYPAAFERVKSYLAAGDIYQANLTFRCPVAFEGDPADLYWAVRPQARAGYGALIATGDLTVLSFSPELFFTLQDGRLLARPMKGTATRGQDEEEDAANVAALVADPKQRAENLMIVDLLRNDLSRVAEAGSVAVPRLFAVETYPTVHQMVSDVTATLKDGLDAFDVLRATFPCGSVTGAPKLRAMEIIAEVETSPRGLYTGSIGRIDPDGSASFNVAIRTLTIANGAGEAVLGLGSGVVADSECEAEWRECLAKARFLGSHPSIV